MKKGFILLLSLCYIISSCGNLSEKEIEETTSTGVVLVQNQSYYEVVLSNGDPLLPMIPCNFPNNSCKYSIDDTHSLPCLKFLNLRWHNDNILSF